MEGSLRACLLCHDAFGTSISLLMDIYKAIAIYRLIRLPDPHYRCYWTSNHYVDHI